MSFLLSAKGCIPIDGGGSVEMERIVVAMHSLLSETWPFQNALRQGDELSFKVFTGGLFVPGPSPLAMVTSGTLRFGQEGTCLKLDYEISFKRFFVLICVVIGGICLLAAAGVVAKGSAFVGGVGGLILALPIVVLWLFGFNRLLATWRVRRFLEKTTKEMVAALNAGRTIVVPKDLWHSGWW